VHAERPAAGAEAVRRLLDDPALRSRLGQAGRRAVESFYNWDRVATDLRRIGHELAATGTGVAN
jgi:glycosyltransferase involved in cell wall biosynthesis